MEMPLFLPTRLQHYGSAVDDTKLFTLLVKNRAELLDFFEYASDHETWSEDHSEFMGLALDWFTLHFFENRLMLEDARRVAKKVQEHFSVLSPYLPKNIAFDVKGVIFSVNSLLFGAASPLVQELILHEYRDKSQDLVKLQGISVTVFRSIEESVMTGNVLDLWKQQEEELIQIHRQASSWGFTYLAHACEKILSRYIMRGNVYEKLLEAHRNQWTVLQKYCCDYITDLDLGCRVQAIEETLSFEFLEYVGSAIDIFEKLKHTITHLIFRKRLLEDFMFRDYVNQCPLLKGLDIDNSYTYDENLQSVPQTVIELDISSCGWLRPIHFPLLASAFPHLKKLIIRNNILLNYASWGQLVLFPELIDLDISFNSQITDDDLKMILQAVPNLTDLKADDCTHVTDRGLLEMVRSLSSLTVLSLEKGDMTDGTLIEMVQHCPFLKELNIARCPKITDKGLWDSVRQAKALRKLGIVQTSISENMIRQIKELKPFVEIIMAL